MDYVNCKSISDTSQSTFLINQKLRPFNFFVLLYAIEFVSMSGSKAWQRNSHASLPPSPPPPPPPHAPAPIRLASHKAAVTANSYKHIYIVPTRTYVLRTYCAGYRKERESGTNCSISTYNYLSQFCK